MNRGSKVAHFARSSTTALGLALGGALGLTLACSGGTGAEDVGIVCEFGEGQMCECPDGTQSVSWCLADGSGFAACECGEGNESFGDEIGDDTGTGTTTGDGDTGTTTGDGDTGTSDTGTSDTGTTTGDGDTGTSDTGTTTGDGDTTTDSGDGDTGEPNLDEACYLGPNEDYSVCFPIVSPNPLPAGYDYPGLYQGNVNYRSPVRYLDLDAIDQSAQVAPNFTLDELAQSYKGQYAVVQPHAVDRLQDLRDIVGPIIVNSGYRPPGYNAMIGGATWSRHMYGDAFDLDPVNVGLSTLEAACTNNAGFLVEYESHVHCDWRGVDVDIGFFGLPDQDPFEIGDYMNAELELDPESGEWIAPATGFEEGEPLRRWSAYDGEGELLVEARGRSFAAPPEAVRVEVIVGARVRRSVEF